MLASGYEYSVQERRRFAEEDCEDLRSADLVIAFTEPARSAPSRGGRHVELGMAIERWHSGNCRFVFVVGPRENVFCALKEVQQYETWEQCCKDLRSWAPSPDRLTGEAHTGPEGPDVDLPDVSADELRRAGLQLIAAQTPAGYLAVPTDWIAGLVNAADELLRQFVFTTSALPKAEHLSAFVRDFKDSQLVRAPTEMSQNGGQNLYLDGKGAQL